MIKIKEGQDIIDSVSGLALAVAVRTVTMCLNDKGITMLVDSFIQDEGAERVVNNINNLSKFERLLVGPRLLSHFSMRLHGGKSR